MRIMKRGSLSWKWKNTFVELEQFEELTQGGIEGSEWWREFLCDLCLGSTGQTPVLFPHQLKLWIDSMIFDFIKETYLLLLFYSLHYSSSIYLGYQITPNFVKEIHSLFY